MILLRRKSAQSLQEKNVEIDYIMPALQVKICTRPDGQCQSHTRARRTE